MPPSAPYSMPGRRAPRRGRAAGRSRRSLEVVGQRRRRGRARRRCAGRCISAGLGDAARARPAAAAQPVALGIHRRGGQAALAEGEDPVVGAAGEHRGEHLAPAVPMAVPPARRNGTSLPRSAASSSSSSRSCRAPRGGRRPRAWRPRRPSPRPCRRPPGCPCGSGCAPARRPRPPGRGAGPRARRGCSPSVGTPSASGPCDLEAPLVGEGDGDLVEQADRVVDGRQGVVAVLATGADQELEVDLGRDAHGR